MYQPSHHWVSTFSCSLVQPSSSSGLWVMFMPMWMGTNSCHGNSYHRNMYSSCVSYLLVSHYLGRCCLCQLGLSLSVRREKLTSDTYPHKMPSILPLLAVRQIHPLVQFPLPQLDTSVDPPYCVDSHMIVSRDSITC